MRISKKGQREPGEMLFYVPYLIMAVFIVFALAEVPAGRLEAAVKPIPLDAAIFEEKAIQHITKYSPVSGVEEEQVTPVLDKAVQFSLSPKKYGYLIEVGDQKFYGNELFYVSAEPLAPARYHQYESYRQWRTDEGIVTIHVDQVYPKSYAKFT